MIASVSCRQLSPPLAVAVLLLVTILASPPASAATMVQSIAVSTDRTDYVNMPGFNRVTATANVTFNGNGALDPVRFDWFAPGVPMPVRTLAVPPTQVRLGTAVSSDSWVADREGIGFTVFASINVFTGSPPEVSSPPATFNVYNRSAIVVVTDIVVTTSPVFENATVAPARADLTYAGNSSFLSGVRFDWYTPGWVLAFSETDTSPQPTSPSTAVAGSTWAIDRTGNGFHVNATYLGSGAVSNTTAFDVVGQRVKTWLPAGDLNGRVVLDAFSSPWGVCTNTSVNVGAELVIQPGTVIRFCRDTGLFVNGTLTVNAFPTSRVYFLSYELQMRAGDWRGITFLPGAPGNSILSNAAIQAVREAVTVRGAAVTIQDSTIALATGPAISLTGSASRVSNTAISQADIGIRVDASTGVVLDGNRIQGTRIGILATDSDVTLSANDVSLNRNAGLQGVRSTVVVDGGTFRDNGVGVFLSEVPQAAFGRVAISGGNDSLRAVDSRALVVAMSSFSGAMYRSVFFINVTATFVNTTLRAIQYDLVLVASLTTLVNSTYAVLLPPVSSVLTIKNFLHVLVESNLATRPRVENAWVNVSSDGLAVSSRGTTATGWSLWVLLTDRTIHEGSRTVIVANVVEVHLNGFDAISSPRSVDMASSHAERFLVVPSSSTPGLNLGFDAILLLLLAVVMGTVLLAMPAMRRRKDHNHAPRARPVARHVPLERGSSYFLPDEKPDRAFQILASEIAHGGKALVIARLYPDEVRKRYGLKDVPVLWLSRGYGKETVNPTNLGALVQDIERFMSGKEDSVVLLDGLEYLLVQNDPQKVVKFIQVLVDSASVHHSKLLISFDVKAVNEAVRALITRDLQSV
jgi:parallel beta-helix repeat protein